MDYFNALVAGGDDAGYRDGSFEEARFNQPSGLAFDPEGNRLFVADTGNHVLRVVRLDRENRVETLAGTGTPGMTDGPLPKASFDNPTVLAFIPPNQLAVFDSGNKALRLVDLQAGRVTTLAGGPSLKPALAIWAMAYHAGDGSLYFSEPGNHRVQKMDLRTQQTIPLFSGNPLLPSPAALCFFKDRLYVADQSFPTIYEVEFPPAGPAGSPPVSLKEAGKGEQVLGMAVSDDVLYALQGSKVFLLEVLPEARAVSLATPWGYPLENQNPGSEPLFQFQSNNPPGFAASPLEPRKLYLSSPNPHSFSILSVKDYGFDKLWKSYTGFDFPLPPDRLTDFNYPPTKPPRTFRILVTGDSRVLTAPAIIPGATLPAEGGNFNEYNWTTDTNRVNSFPQQLQLQLNAEAVLRGADIHFEVLTLARHGSALGTYAPEEVPPFIEKYDVDLVLALVGKAGYEDYFEKPLNAEGIPTNHLDPEFLLKPLETRLPAGPAQRLYLSGKRKNLFLQGQGYPFWWQLLGPKGDEQMRKDLLEMTGKPLRLFTERVQKTRNKSGKTPQLLFFYVPWRDWDGNDLCESFWSDLSAENHFSLLNLGPSFNVLKTSFYPTNQPNCMRHYTASGNSLIAYLLRYYLIAQKWVPLEPFPGEGRKN